MAKRSRRKFPTLYPQAWVGAGFQRAPTVWRASPGPHLPIATQKRSRPTPRFNLPQSGVSPNSNTSSRLGFVKMALGGRLKFAKIGRWLSGAGENWQPQNGLQCKLGNLYTVTLRPFVCDGIVKLRWYGAYHSLHALLERGPHTGAR